MSSRSPKVDVPILWIENSRSDAPVIVLCPGLAMSASKYRGFGESLRNKGFHVAICELRGQGEYTPGSGRTEDHGLAEMVGTDVPAVLEVAKSRFPDSDIVLAGHSLGGCVAALTAAVGSTASNSLVGVVTVATSTGYYKVLGKKQALLILCQTAAAKLVMSMWGYYPGDRRGFGGIQPKTLMQQWADMARTGDLYIEHLVHELSKPMLVIGIEGDQVAPPAAVNHFAGKFLAARVTRREISLEHQRGTKDSSWISRTPHSSWVKWQDAVAEQIEQWYLTVKTTVHQ